MTVHPTSEAPSHGRDTGAAFMGLILGAIALFCLLFGVVKLTNAHYEHVEAAAAAHAPSQTPSPAP